MKIYFLLFPFLSHIATGENLGGTEKRQDGRELSNSLMDGDGASEAEQLAYPSVVHDVVTLVFVLAVGRLDDDGARYLTLNDGGHLPFGHVHEFVAHVQDSS